MRLIKHPPVLNVINAHAVDYPTPINLSYFWNFGGTALIALVLQIITGIALAMHYTPHVDLAFASVEHIMRDVNYGWLIRYMHANGASMFFINIYLHMARGLYYGSYTAKREVLWLTGCVIFLLTVITAFMGYVLPWGQMSFWGATVITKLVGGIPVIGEYIVHWLWGGFSVDNATLNRFFSLHYLLPFLIVGVVILHIVSLHAEGSNNPLGIKSYGDKVPFYPYFIVKDTFGWLAFFMFFGYFVYFDPNVLGHPDNYIEANPMVTPAHIVPEWYLLPFYAILRSIPDKLGGIIAMGGAILVLFIQPFIHTTTVRSSFFRPIYKKFYWLMVVDTCILGWIGACVPDTPYLEIGQLATVYYFFFFLIVVPFLGKFEDYLATRVIAK